MEYYVWDIQEMGTTAGSPIAIEVKPVGFPSQASCVLASDSPTTALTVTKTRAAWMASPYVKWKFSSPATGTSGTFKASTCRIDTQTRFISPAGISYIERNNQIEGVRCDTWAKNNWYKNGGCSISRLSAIILLDKKDKDEKTGLSWPEQVDHIKKALTAPNSTVPKLGGTPYPDSAGKSKNIPGQWTGGQTSTLHRLFDDADSRTSYEKSVATCKREIAKSWVTDVKKHPTTAENCDEFPMASTAEGSHFAKPPWNYSVELISAVQNQMWGRKLKAWYRNHRVLPGEPFHISIID